MQGNRKRACLALQIELLGSFLSPANCLLHELLLQTQFKPNAKIKA